MRKSVLVLFCSGIWLISNQLVQADQPWPQFRGPGGSGISENAQPPVRLGPATNVKWKTSAPGGSSSPIIADNLLVMTAFDAGKLWTIAYQIDNGKEAWKAEAPFQKLESYHKTEGSPAASTPAFDGTRIVSYFGSCGLFCYNTQGKLLWKYEMPPAKTVGDFGTGVSPLLVEGAVILLRDEQTDPKIISLNAATGKLNWEVKRESTSGYSTPVVWKTNQGTQIVAPGYGRLVAYDLATGKEVWHLEGMPSASCTTPVISEGWLFYAGWSPGDASDESGFKMPSFEELLSRGNADKNRDGALSREESKGTFIEQFFDNNDPNKNGQIEKSEWDGMLSFMARSKPSAFAIAPGGTGDVSKTHLKWTQKEGLPYVPSAICYQGLYVLVKDGGIVTVYNAKTGKRIDRERLEATGSYYASPVAANNRIYFTSLQEGIVTVAKVTPNGIEKELSNPPLQERVAATPVILNNTLFIRTAGHLYAFSEKK